MLEFVVVKTGNKNHKVFTMVKSQTALKVMQVDTCKGHSESTWSLLPIPYKRLASLQHYHSFLACQTRKMFKLAVLVSSLFIPSLAQLFRSCHLPTTIFSSAVRPLLLLRLRPRPTPTTATAMALVATLDMATLA